jgi:hypothetical protein
MYRTNDPRFRRRLNEIGQTLESANESAQSGLYIFAQSYIRPCFASLGNCLVTCVDASCPSLNLQNRDRLRRRGRARSRGRAELNFDFYDDWDEEEADGLLGWGNDDFDNLTVGSAGYGTVSQTQPARQRGMSYPKARRKSAHEGTPGPDGQPGTSFFGRLFGGKSVRYKPSAADLQEHPGARKSRKDGLEGEALLEESEPSEGTGAGRRHRRVRSNTVGSAGTGGSYSSRGDLFPSDEEDDAIPLDDEFAMVLERRHTGTLSGPETDTSPGRTKSVSKQGKRPSTGSRVSSRRTVSSRSTRSSTANRGRSRTNSSAAETPVDEAPLGGQEDFAEDELQPPTLSELTHEEQQLAEEEEADIERRRQEAQCIASDRGLTKETEALHDASQDADTEHEPYPGPHDAIPAQSSKPSRSATLTAEESVQLPSPLPTDDEEDPANVAQDACDSAKPKSPSA